MLDYNVTYREKDGSLQAIISYKDSNGKWRQKGKQGFENNKKGEKKAKAWALETLEELKNNSTITKEYDDITFIEYYKLFINDRFDSLRASTIVGYENAVKRFEPIHNLRLKDIKTIDIQREVNKLNHLSSVSIESYLKKIRCLFNFAIEKYEIIKKNPAKNIEFTGNSPKEKTALTNTELEQLLNNLKPLRTYKYYIASLLASKCGLRIGELCGLTWNDIDFANMNININKQWIKDKNGVWGFDKVKTNNSYRIIPAPKNVLIELANIKKSYPIDIDGRILKVKNTVAFSANLISAYRRFGFDISIHELRHTYATNLIANGLDFKTAAMLLGHDVEETMRTYTHVNADMIKNAKNLIEKIF